MSDPRESIANIGLEGFLERCREEVQVPASETRIREMTERLSSVTFLRSQVWTAKLLETQLYLAIDLSLDGTHWIKPGSNTPLAQRRLTTLQQSLSDAALSLALADLLAEGREGRPTRTQPRAIALHCSRCDARWLFDGNRGLFTICRAGTHCLIELIEMSCPNWQGHLRGCSC